MAKAESTNRSSVECLNVEFMRSLVKQYSELGQWTSALFWADAAAATASGPGPVSGDDMWLLASAMLARGELHRAAHAITSRGLHKQHLLCLGVTMRAYIQAREPGTALSLLEECDPMLLEPRSTDTTHNRALAGVLVGQARALSQLERREAAAGALGAALRADCACYEALDLLLDQHALTPRQEMDLLESLPISSQLGAAEGMLLRAAYRERMNRHTPANLQQHTTDAEGAMGVEVETVRSRTTEAAICRGRRLAVACEWGEALKLLDTVDPWCCADVRAACLVELKKSSELFAFAHTLVDAYPNSWVAWFAVGCYYYLIGKSEFARRYLSKAKSLEPGAGCVWLAYGHSFAADNEHDQAMAAYFKASQLMAGSHLPPLYVGMECSLLNNVSMCERFLMRAATLHSDVEREVCDREDRSVCPGSGPGAGWERIGGAVRSAHVAHEAAAAAYSAGEPAAARALWLVALDVLNYNTDKQLGTRWAATLDGLGHACRSLGQIREALSWHEQALALRPGRPATLAARALCQAMLGQSAAAADSLHAALARDPDDVVALALLDAVLERLDAQLAEEEIPQFPFPTVTLSPPPPEPAPPALEGTLSDMSMSFD